MNALAVIGALLLAWTVLARVGWRVARLPLRWLRRVPPLFGGVWLLAVVGVLGGWLLAFQPAAGLPFALEEGLWLGGGMTWALGWFTCGLDRDGLRALNGRWVNPFVTLVTLCLLILGAELWLRYGVAMSDSFAFSKMHQNWYRLYWQPVNAYGYRDNPPNDDPTRRHVLVMGDSFAVGYGVNDIADTFPHQLARLLGDAYAVNVVAVPGFGVGSAFADLQRYPTAPDVLVLSHYLNDIAEGTAGRVLPPLRGLRRDPDPAWIWWVENAYLANFYYYRVYHYAALNTGERYMDYLRAAYANPEAWAIYASEELEAVVGWVRERDVPLYVVVWCNLADCEGSADMLAPVLAYFAARDVPTVNTLTLFAGIAPQQLMVNPFDAHPSVLAHQRVSEALHALITVP